MPNDNAGDGGMTFGGETAEELMARIRRENAERWQDMSEAEWMADFEKGQAKFFDQFPDAQFMFDILSRAKQCPDAIPQLICEARVVSESDRSPEMQLAGAELVKLLTALRGRPLG